MLCCQGDWAVMAALFPCDRTQQGLCLPDGSFLLPSPVVEAPQPSSPVPPCLPRWGGCGPAALHSHLYLVFSTCLSPSLPPHTQLLPQLLPPRSVIPILSVLPALRCPFLCPDFAQSYPCDAIAEGLSLFCSSSCSHTPLSEPDEGIYEFTSSSIRQIKHAADCTGSPGPGMPKSR